MKTIRFKYTRWRWSAAVSILMSVFTSLVPASETSPVRLVKDINPGSAGAGASQYVVLNGVAYFRANDGTHGLELWRSDGTEAGTQLVTDLRTGPANGFPENITVANGSLYFSAINTAELRGSKVWRSDGTAAGTVLVADTYPEMVGGGTPAGPPLPGGFTALNADTVLFTALDPISYLEPWRTDGASVGTRRIKDLHPGPQGSFPVEFTLLRDVAYFTADDSLIDHGDGTATFNRELFRTDGTEAGTFRVKDINPGPYPSGPFGFIPWAGYLYFRANDGTHGAELWRTDGTDTGTIQVADLNPGPAASNPEGFVVADLGGAAVLVFIASDSESGEEVFLHDGTAGGTRLVKDINPSGDSAPRSLTPFNGKVYFNADDGVHGPELWVTDGTAPGTGLFKDLNPGGGIGAPMDFTVVGDRLFFVSIGPGGTDSTVKTQLWSTDGTVEGTQLVFEEPGSSTGYAIRNLTALGDQLLFTAPKDADPMASVEMTNFSFSP